MVAAIIRDRFTEFDHPRYYNIRWTEILTEVHENLRPFESVLRDGR